MPARERQAGAGAYPERDDAPAPALERFFAGLRYRLRRVFARAQRDSEARAAAVRLHMGALAAAPLVPQLPGLRHALRRDGFAAEAVARCLGGYCAAAQKLGCDFPSPSVLGAAERLVAGGIVELAGEAERVQALAMAAAVMAAGGRHVHVLAASDAGAQRLVQALRPPLELLGLSSGAVLEGMGQAERREAYARQVTCAAYRQVASDYLQDRLRAGASLSTLAGRLGSLADSAPAGSPCVLRGLSCALVAEADWVMVDDAITPVVVSEEADRSRERLVYEQALEFARALLPGVHFEGPEVPKLTADGRRRLEKLVAPLGGAWSARARREQLIETALCALHACRRGRDYEVQGARVAFAQAAGGTPAENAEAEHDLRGMIELKEGCRLSAARNVLARLAVPRFLRRYLHLAGVCADARGLEGEFWDLYALQTTLAGARPAPFAAPACLFDTAASKHRALLERVRDGDGMCVVGLRTPREAQLVMQALQGAGIAYTVLRGTGAESDHQAFAALEQPGAVVLALHPVELRVAAAPAGPVRRRLVLAELHDASRQVARMRRVYGAHSCELLLSLEDEALAQLDWIAGAGVLGPRRAARLQRRAEAARTLARQEAMSREQFLGDLLAFAGARD